MTSFAFLAFGHNLALALAAESASNAGDVSRWVTTATSLGVLGALAYLTTRRNTVAWKAVQVGMLLLTGLAANVLNPGSNNTGTLLIGAAVILVLSTRSYVGRSSR